MHEQSAPFKIDGTPREPEGLATSQATETDKHKREEPLIIPDRVKQTANPICIWNGSLDTPDGGRLHQRCNIPNYMTALLRKLQGCSQTDQRVLARARAHSRIGERLLPGLDVRDGQLPQWNIAEAGPYVQLYELSVIRLGCRFALTDYVFKPVFQPAPNSPFAVAGEIGAGFVAPLGLA